MKLLLAITGVAVLIYDLVLFSNPDKETFYNYLFNLAYAAIFFMGMFIANQKAGRLAGQPNLRKSMRLFGIGMFFYGLGLVIWTWYNLVLQIPIPYPSLADISFILYYPAVIAGIYFMIKSFGGKITRKQMFESFLVFVSLFITIYVFVNQTSLGPDVPFWARFLNVIYPLVDSLLVAFAIAILRTEHGYSSHPYILYLVFGFLILATADTVFSYRSAAEVYWNGDISDLMFALSGFLTAWGFISVPNVGIVNKSIT